MEKIIIKDTNEQLTKNFSMREFYHPKFMHTKGEFEMPKCLPLAVQAMRDFFTNYYGKDIPFQITSTIRTGTDNFTKHKDCVDSIPLVNTYEIMNMINHEFQNWEDSVLVNSILETGTNVLLYENGCIHLAWRDFSLNPHPNYITKNKEVAGRFYIGFWSPNGTPSGKNICYA